MKLIVVGMKHNSIKHESLFTKKICFNVCAMNNMINRLKYDTFKTKIQKT